MRWALKRGDTCVLVVEQDGPPTVDGPWVDVTGLPVGPGSRYQGGQWLAPAPAIPPAVTMRRARLALHAAGLLGGVEAAIAALPEPTKTQAQIEWEYSNEVQRNNGIVAQLGPALGLNDAQLDALFISAAAIP